MIKNFAEYQARRQRLFDQMVDNSIAILFTAPHYQRSADQHHRFYPDNDFYYFTGFTEPEAAAVLIKSKQDGCQYILFNRVKNPLEEQWVGRRVGQEQALIDYGADQAYPISTFVEKMTLFMLDKECIYHIWGRNGNNDIKIKNILNDLRGKVRAGINIPTTLINLESVVHEMRLIKAPSEIALLQKAVDISVSAHKRAMRLCRPGLNESLIRAEMIYEFLRLGCHEEAYDLIIGSGENACVLHYIEDNQDLKDGELLLVDAGGCYEFYDADLTRTFPINGHFTGEQRALYEIVLAAQKAALDEIRPGQLWNVMGDAATKVITQGLIDLGLLKGRVDDLIEQEAYLPFYMHRIGHWLGMDVHDVGCYKISGEWRPLLPGMVTTVEPGIYIKPGLPVDEKWWGMGIRIEDNVLITETGYDILSKDLPKEIADIEATMASGR